ncbi:MAG: hypothetical protein ABSD38_25270 [Syntrophorhabdales bacterium]|jgi:hypothetical protein
MDKDVLTGDVMECCRLMEEAGWELDKVTVIDLVMDSQSWAAVYMVVGWFELIEGKPDRSKAYLAKAKAACATEGERAYVLHVESMASLRMGDIGTALEREHECFAICRRTKDRYLLTRVLVQLGAISNALDHDSSDLAVEKAAAQDLDEEKKSISEGRLNETALNQLRKPI